MVSIVAVDRDENQYKSLFEIAGHKKISRFFRSFVRSFVHSIRRHFFLFFFFVKYCGVMVAKQEEKSFERLLENDNRRIECSSRSYPTCAGIYGGGRYMILFLFFVLFLADDLKVLFCYRRMRGSKHGTTSFM